MLSEDRLAFVLSLDLYSLDFINIPATLHYGNLETQPTIIICEKITSDYEKLGEIFRNNNSQIYFYYKKNSAHNGKDLIINPDNLSVTLWILMDKRKNSLFITFVILVNICGKCSEYPTHFTSTLMKCHCNRLWIKCQENSKHFLYWTEIAFFLSLTLRHWRCHKARALHWRGTSGWSPWPSWSSSWRRPRGAPWCICSSTGPCTPGAK